MRTYRCSRCCHSSFGDCAEEVAPTGRRVGAGVALSGCQPRPQSSVPWGPLAAGGRALATGHATLPCLSEPQGIGAEAAPGVVAAGPRARGGPPGPTPDCGALASVHCARGAGPTPECGLPGGLPGGKVL
jgi:hypothetical protein